MSILLPIAVLYCVCWSLMANIFYEFYCCWCFFLSPGEADNKTWPLAGSAARWEHNRAFYIGPGCWHM